MLVQERTPVDLRATIMFGRNGRTGPTESMGTRRVRSNQGMKLTEPAQATELRGLSPVFDGQLEGRSAMPTVHVRMRTDSRREWALPA